ncbi:hypothetical protein LJC24_05460, partial [Desulfococcaceae bacterium OttesenSCG-928-F15]|nr:hypothetical protein [Desulfococcaceae bacterium OttesenSCG-928-F15]
AIYSAGALTITDSAFTNNTATATANATANANGGAIYAGGTVILTAEKSDILFQGNTVKATKNGVTTTKANAIYLENLDNNKSFTLAASSGKNILFYDPVESKSINSNLTIDINPENTHTGTVVFDGSYWLSQNQTPTNNPAYFTSAVYGNTTVHKGTLALKNGVTYGAANHVGSFTLKNGATLAARGVYTNIVQADTITLENSSILAFDLSGAKNTDDSNPSLNLMLNGGTVTAGNIVVDIQAFNGTGTFKLATRSNGTWGTSNVALITHGEAIANTRAAELVSLGLATTTNLNDTLQLVSTAENGVVTWNTTNGIWDATSKNWDTSKITGKENDQRFLYGDAVVFGADTFPTDGTIEIQEKGVTIAARDTNPAMEIKSGNWIFTGGGITSNQSGKLSISSGSADFTDIIGTNSFGDGIEIGTGKLIVTNANQLGTTLSRVSFTVGASGDVDAKLTALNNAVSDYNNTQNDTSWQAVLTAMAELSQSVAGNAGSGIGTITFTDSITLNAGDTDNQRLNVAENNAASFELADGTILTIKGNNYSTGNGGAVVVGENGLFAVTGGGSIVFENNSASENGGGIYNDSGMVSFAGETSFTNNSANYGGGTSNDSGTVSFSGPATFTGNSVSEDGGGIYNDSGMVSFFGPATFTGNTASENGGGISNYGTMSFAGPAIFTDNSASLGGGGFSNAGTMSFAGPASFTGNSASENGGGISNDSMVSFSGPATFTGNTASENGGGIENTGTVSFAGETSFTGNTADNGSGGGIYNGGTVKLTPTNADDTILFSGNTASGSPNSIHMSASGTLNVGGAGTIDMRDPMAGNADNNTITISKTEAGAWKLGGENKFTSVGSGKTTFTVSGGSLHLYRADEVNKPTTANPNAKVAVGTISLAGTGSSFTLGTGATLSLGGTGHSITAATIKLENSSTLAFDLAHHGNTATD